MITPRERAVLASLARGKRAKEVALELGISIHTVYAHERKACARLGTSNVLAAVATAIRRGEL